MDDRERVTAVMAGDPRGMADVYDTYADRLFAFCHAMLRDRQAAEDAVHDTFVVLAVRVGQLRDPDRLRPWLYAVARSHCLRQLRNRRRSRPTDELPDTADDDMTTGRDLEQQELQALVWAAADGLNPGERAALELSLRHDLGGDDLAAALGVPRGTATKLLFRGREHLERGLGALLVTRAGSADCAELAGLTQGWDGTLTPLWRKRIGRHIDECDVCGECRRRVVSAAAIFGDGPLAMAPVSLRTRLFGVEHGPEVAGDRTVARRAGRFDRDGFPTDDPGRRRGIVAAASAVVAAAVVVAAVAAATSTAHRPTTTALVAGRPSVSAGGSTSGGSTSGGSTPAVSTSGGSTPGGSTSAGRATPGSTSAPTTPVPTTSVVVVPPGPAASDPTTPAVAVPSTSSPTPTPTPPQPVTVTGPTTPPATLTSDATKLDLGATNEKDAVTLTATGGPVTWAATAPVGIALLPAGGTVTPGSPETLEIVLDRTTAAGSSAVVHISWATGSAGVSLEWS